MPKPIANWELLLCGPMLRTVTPTSVSVFVALKHARKVRLSVLPPGSSTTALGEVEVDSRKLGAYLHVALATVKLGTALEPGKIYRYDMTFTAVGPRDSLDKRDATETLASLGLLTGTNGLGYADKALPSFALPPADLDDLKLAHGSCRKPHGEKRDAFPILDTIIRTTRTDPFARPHQLFLTGDQIYADDVAKPLLNELTPTGETLLGWSAPETIPGLSKPPSQIRPGDRAAVVHPPLTSGEAHSHLMTLGEFYAMYLLVWSPELWPAAISKFAQLSQAEQERYGSSARKDYDDCVDSVWRFHNTVWKVRRVLANVPTHMIFDDHEITDDWFLHRSAWSVAQTNDLANRIIVNGLAAFAVFQAWGNSPEQFQPDQPGSTLLDALRDWRGQKDDTYKQIQKAVQVPRTGDVGLRWDYEYIGPQHHVIVLDSRTNRGYPSGDDTGAPDLLTPAAMKQQITDRKLIQNKRVTIVVAPAPVFGHWLHVGLSDALGAVGMEATGDREAWAVRHRPACFESLLQALVPFERVVILSGDVHHASAFQVRYWDERKSPERRATFVQFTSSGFKNESGLTRPIGQAPWGIDIAVGGPGRWKAARRAGFLGWDTPGWHLTYMGIPAHASGTPAVRRVPIGASAAIATPPKWRYHSEMLTDTRSARDRGVPASEIDPTDSSLFEQARALVKRHSGVARYDQMRTVVGFNNMATMSFDASPPSSPQPWLYVHQRLWFRLMSDTDEIRPYTTHSANLDVVPQNAGRPMADKLLGAALPNLSAWSDLISMRPPKAVQQTVRKRFGMNVLDWTGHRLESGQGDINLDFYPVRVTRLPQQGGGSTPSGLLKIIRLWLNNYIDKTVSTFKPYEAPLDDGVWTSDNPLGAVVSIQMLKLGLEVDRGSVVVSSFRPDRWVFSTVWTPNDLGHPVSGNRAFGYFLNEDGSCTFYTRGADRTTGLIDYGAAAVGQVFSAADQLWLSLQDGIVNYVKTNGGEATKEPRHSERYPWPEVSTTYWRPVEDWIP